MTSAIRFVFESLVDQFRADSLDIDVAFGFQAPSLAVLRPRVCVVPGDRGLELGEMTEAKRLKTTTSPVLYSTWLTLRLFLDAPQDQGSVDELTHLDNLFEIRDATLRALKYKLGNLWRREDEVYSGDPGSDGLGATRLSYMGLVLTISVLDDTLDAVSGTSLIHADGELTVDELDTEVVSTVP